MYLLDTDTCIYLINKQPISILEIIKSLSPYEVGISAITVAELEFGVDISCAGTVAHMVEYEPLTPSLSILFL